MAALLEVERVEAGYGTQRVLFGVSLRIDEGEALALVGRNGMGKTTTIRSVLGLSRPAAGRVRFAGRDVTGESAHRIARRGIGLVPEGRRIFPTLTVRENLIAASGNHGGLASPWALRDVYALFPRLEERERHPGSRLSGGEQQMLAIGRALLLGPRLLILDEATEGLAPVIRGEIWNVLRDLRAHGQAILIVDKHLSALATVAERAVVLEKGRDVWTGPSAELAANEALHRRYLGA